MPRLLIACLCLVAITGCSGGNDSLVPSKAPGAGTPPSAVSTQDQRRTLAYTHTIQIEAPEEQIAHVHEAGLAACKAAAADLCTVLDSRITTGRFASASLRLRAKPSGIAKLIAALSQQGALTEQSTQAEDLTGPIRDGEKQLAMLTSYRDELEALRKRAGNDAEALIKVTHELARVQSDLEAAAGNQARLAQRVDTELLDVNIRTGRNSSFWHPISVAASEFRGSLSQGIASAITGVAYLLPWSLVIAVVVWVMRKLWRRRKPRP